MPEKEPIFRPWVGGGYASDGLCGRRVLLMGEAHYAEEEYDGHADLTREIVQRVRSGEARFPFFTKVRKLLSAAASLDEAGDEFWDRVAFYNYVQQVVGAGARIRPTAAMWEDARERFASVLREHRPDVVVVLGVDLWNRIRFPAGSTSEILLRKNGIELRTWCVSGGPTMVATWTSHPSSYGFHRREWEPRVRAALNTANARSID